MFAWPPSWFAALNGKPVPKPSALLLGLKVDSEAGSQEHSATTDEMTKGETESKDAWSCELKLSAFMPCGFDMPRFSRPK